MSSFHSKSKSITSIILISVATNAINNGCSPLSVEDLHEKISENDNIQIIDVREPAEREANGIIEGSINLPLDILRENLDKIPRDKLVILHCARGLRGYLAAKILQQHGFTNINKPDINKVIPMISGTKLFL